MYSQGNCDCCRLKEQQQPREVRRKLHCEE
jgi:hypothetical protein